MDITKLGSSNHQTDLVGQQGGSSTEQFHLTAAEYTGTGTGAFVRQTSPTLITPVLGVATATSINKVALTQPATGATLTIADGKTATDTSAIGAAILKGATGGGFSAAAAGTDYVAPSGSGTGLLSSTTNFGRILSATDTTLQAALDTLDDNAEPSASSTINTTGGTTALTAAQSAKGLFIITGVLASNATITFPDTGVVPQKFIVKNSTTGAFTVTFKHVSTAGVIITQTEKNLLFTSGTVMDNLTTTPAGSGITTLNGLTPATQTFATGSTGTDFAISSAGSSHSFLLPDASATARGLITTGTQTIAGAKTFTGSLATVDQTITLPATGQVLVDARTNPRTITLGAFRINHTPAITGTRPISLDVDAAGYGDTRGMAIHFLTGAVGAGSHSSPIDIQVDNTGSTGGDVHAVMVSKLGSGSASITALECESGVAPILQETGTYGAADQAYTYNGAYTDQNAAFASSGTNVQIFVANGDYVYLGHSTTFNAINAMLSIVASGAGVKPTFEYWSGAAWTAFSPSDGTNGFRQNGIIGWTLPLAGWATNAVNAVTKYWIRIARTQNTLTTVPTESTVKIILSVDYTWNASGALSVASLSASGTLAGSNLSGTNTGDQTISDATISTTDITTNNVSTSKHGFAPKAPNDATKFLDGTGAYTVPAGSGGDPAVCNGRLTLTSGTPVTIDNVTAAGTIYFTPYKGNKIGLYNGTTTTWDILTFTQFSLTLTATASKVYDVFVYNNGGTAALETLVWTNDTTRATSLVLQDGILCKSGALTRRYVGTFYAGASNQTEDSVAKRYVWNYYNRVPRIMYVHEATATWTVTTSGYGSVNANAANALDFVSGVAEDSVHVSAAGNYNMSGGGSCNMGIGLDVTNAIYAGGNGTYMQGTANVDVTANAVIAPQLGRHLVNWIERSNAAATGLGEGGGTGANRGIRGIVLA